MKRYSAARWIGGKYIIYKIIDNKRKEAIAECKEAKYAYLIVRSLNKEKTNANVEKGF